MCGICGSFYKDVRDRNELSSELDRMCGQLGHRGPDAINHWINEESRVGFGHTRLSIIDLSVDGSQPMTSACGRWTISYNGEIYNYREMRKELAGRSVRFRGHSDTEVLLEAIALDGLEKALEKTVGMFAFALWNQSDGTLHLARDRAGKKPLYYFQGSDKMYFASEIKAIRIIFGSRLTLDMNALSHYLSLGYIPSPLTIYREIREVPAGQILEVGPDFKQTVKPYWNLYKNRQPSGCSFQDAVQQTDELLQDAVRIRLRSDVPLGCFLSGGIDSGLITAVASRLGGNRLTTLTVRVDDQSFDESPLAAQVSAQYGTKHHILQIKPDIKNDLETIVRAYDEPFADPSAIPSYLISREARKHVTVVLNGDGGDELFGGYRRHRAISLLAGWQPFLSVIPRGLLRQLTCALPAAKNTRTRYAFIRRFLQGTATNPYQRYILWGDNGFRDSEKMTCFSEPAIEPVTETFLSDKFSFMEKTDAADHFMLMDALLALPDCLLVKMDIASMANSLEARSPFLDHRMMEFSFGLSQKSRLPGNTTKPILRELAHRYLPQEVCAAPKRGFELPVSSWLQNDLKEQVREICMKPNGMVLEIMEKNKIEALLENQTRLDRTEWSRKVWILFMLGMWKEVHENRAGRA